jgi:HTH-type transcriptional regulator, sugar sensing transcriptional regulator
MFLLSSLTTIMSLSDKTKKAMEEVGLGSYEIKVYISLLENGSMAASEISKKSNVPYSKIYEVLNSLEERGWIESNSSRPQKFFPNSPQTATQTTRTLIEKKIDSNNELIIQELMPIYEKTGIKERPEIWAVMGLFNIANKVQEIIQNCKKELLIALPQGAENIVGIIQGTLRTLSEKGVKIAVLVSENTSKETILTISRVAEVRVKNNMFGGGVIGDINQVMILLGNGRNEKGSVEPIAIWADHIGLTGFAKEYFSYLWSDASSK